MKPEGPENPVQHEGHPGQVARVLEKGDSQEHEHDQGREPHDASDSVDDARNHQGPEKSCGQGALRNTREPPEKGFEPAHQNFAPGKGELVEPHEDRHHDNRAQEPMGQNPVYPVRDQDTVIVSGVTKDSLPQDGVDKTVAVVCYDSLGVGVLCAFQVSCHPCRASLQAC